MVGAYSMKYYYAPPATRNQTDIARKAAPPPSEGDAYRWFCCRGLEGDVADHSTFSVSGLSGESSLLQTSIEARANLDVRISIPRAEKLSLNHYVSLA
jgi:hypothetical protein